MPKKKVNPRDYPFVPKEQVVKKIWDFFKEEKTLGEGASCSVHQVLQKKDGKKNKLTSPESFAMKVMKIDDEWNPMLFKKEAHILDLVKHEFILRYHSSWIDKSNFYLLTRLLSGGELFDRIKERKAFNKRQAQHTMTQLVSAIAHCHSHNIVHRDLKPENIVYKERGGEDIAVIDFGDALEVEDDVDYDDFVGTAFYLAPECVRNRKGHELKKSDCWTMGVICYVLVTGRPPFWGRDNREILKRILNSKLKFPKKNHHEIDHETKHFIKAFLKRDPDKRQGAEQALQSTFLGGEGGESHHHHHHKKHKKKHKKRAPEEENGLGYSEDHRRGRSE